MTTFVSQALQCGFATLKKISNSPFLDAEVLLSHVLKKDRTFLFTYPEKKLTSAQERKIKSLVVRRKKHEPIAYIIGHKEFYGLNFFVNHDVLIPRPETEKLIEQVISFSNNKNIKICEMGTGSGCIAIALARNLPKAQILATDISRSALKIAKINAKRHKVLKQIQFIHSDLFSKIPPRIRFNIIIANLPYLSQKQYENTQPEIKNFEPRLALVGGKTGMEIYKKLLQQTKNHLKKGGKVFLENYC